MNRFGPIVALCLALTVQPGHVTRVHDGDTFFLYDLNPRGEEAVRVMGIDTPELNEPKGLEARTFTEQWLARGPFRLMWCGRRTFSRLEATVSRDGIGLHEALRAAGFAK